MIAPFAARFHFLLRPSQPAIGFTLRNTAAAVAALLIAIALGLDSPHWAAMTVWIVAQPTRGMVVSKGLYRLAGTMLGSAAAGAIILLFGHAPLMLSLALAAWVGLCAGASTLLRGFRAYGAVLAGYSAALVAVIGLGHHDDITGVAVSRVATVALGIVVSGTMTLLFLPGSGARDLLVRARVLSRDTLTWAAAALNGGTSTELSSQQHRLLAEIAQINAQADMAAAGSAGMAVRIAHMRALIAALLTLMAQVRARTLRPRPGDASLAEALTGMAANPAKARPETFAPWPEVAVPLSTAMESYRALASQADVPGGEGENLHHPDWRTACLAMLRAFGGVAAAGLLWATTGWGDGPYMLMAAAIMCSVFAATDTPSRNVLLAMKGSALAVAAAALSALALSGWGPGEVPLAASLALAVPFMLLSGLAMSNRATLIPGTDFGMLYLLLAQPGVPAHPPPPLLLDMGIGILCGMATAALVNRLGQAADPQRRLDALSAEIVHDLRHLALSRPGRGTRWRNKAYHRILRLVLKANEAGGASAHRLDGALAALNVGMGVNRVRAVLHHGSPPEASRAGARAVLDAFAHLTRDPEGLAALALAEAGRQGTGSEEQEIAAALLETADSLAWQPEFFKVSG